MLFDSASGTWGLWGLCSSDFPAGLHSWVFYNPAAPGTVANGAGAGAGDTGVSQVRGHNHSTFMYVAFVVGGKKSQAIVTAFPKVPSWAFLPLRMELFLQTVISVTY